MLLSWQRPWLLPLYCRVGWLLPLLHGLCLVTVWLSWSLGIWSQQYPWHTLSNQIRDQNTQLQCPIKIRKCSASIRQSFTVSSKPSLSVTVISAVLSQSVSYRNVSKFFSHKVCVYRTQRVSIGMQQLQIAFDSCVICTCLYVV